MSPLPDPAACAYFAPLDPWAAQLRALGRWPRVEEIDRVVAADACVRFELAPPKPRSLRGRAKSADPYDARIVDDGVVPTRASSLHDLMNALVWAAFPRSKQALHARQRALVASSADPSRRTVEHDTIAMLDEGGVLVFSNAEHSDGDAIDPRGCIVFGHAIYQHLAERRTPVYGLGVKLAEVSSCPMTRGSLALADQALAGMLSEGERFLSHRCFPRVRVA